MRKTKSFNKSIAIFSLAALLALSAVAYSLAVVLPGGKVSAADVKTSALWKSSDSVKNEGTAEGTKLSLTNRTSGEATFKNMLYMRNTTEAGRENAFFANDFKLVFTITSADFKKLTVTLASEHHNTTVTDKLETKFDFINKDGKLALNFKDGAEEDYKTGENEVEAIADASFLNAAVTLTYDAANLKFTVSVGSVSREYAIANAIKDSAAELRFKFDEVEIAEDDEDDLIASVTVSEINGQSLSAGGNVAINDTLDPVVVADTEKLTKNVGSADSPVYAIGSVSDNNLPVAAYDVVQTSLKSTLKVWYSETNGDYGEEPDKTYEDTTHFMTYEKKPGYYKAEYSVPGNAEESGIFKTFIFHAAKADTTAPVIDLTDYEEQVEDFKMPAPAGSEYRVPAPDIVDADGIDNKYTVEWILWYKTPTSSDWTKAEGLKFTPSSQGVYVVRFQAMDASGNLSAATPVEQAISIRFTDLDKPKLTISSFPEKGYQDEELKLPSGSASDTVDSSPTKTVEVYYLGPDGNGERNEDSKIELTNYRFTPKELGKYVAVYTAKDSEGYETTVEKFFNVVVDDRPAAKPVWNFWTPWSITFVCLGSVSLLGIIILLFVRPKKEA